MKYLEESFTVPVGSEAYRDGWDRIFGPNKNAQIVVECIEAFDASPFMPSDHSVATPAASDAVVRALIRVRNSNGFCDVDADLLSAIDSGLANRIGGSCGGGSADAIVLTEAGLAVLDQVQDR